jgi:hypothetical protein
MYDSINSFLIREDPLGIPSLQQYRHQAVDSTKKAAQT